MSAPPRRHPHSRAVLDRIRCAVCRCGMGDGIEDTQRMFRISSGRLGVFALCGECLALPPEDHIRDIARDLRRAGPGDAA